MKQKEVRTFCDFCDKGQKEHGFYVERNVLFYEDSIYGVEGIEINYCPICGSEIISVVEQDGGAE